MYESPASKASLVRMAKQGHGVFVDYMKLFMI